MNITIITYDTAHAKTLDILFQIRTARGAKVNFLLAPFSERPQREVLFAHRPNQFVGPKVRHVAEYYGHSIWEYDARADAVAASDYLIVGGANILEPELANCGKIINGHAGLIPSVRGLDSFKWALVDQKLVGNTVHIIDDQADAGTILHQEITPVFSDDTIESFASRHYKIELCLLSGFMNYLDGGSILDLPSTAPRKRMPMETERQLPSAFEAYKRAHAKSVEV